jgi:hypothetical protein
MGVKIGAGNAFVGNGIGKGEGDTPARGDSMEAAEEGVERSEAGATLAGAHAEARATASRKNSAWDMGRLLDLCKCV